MVENLKIVKTPWETTFVNLLKQSKEIVYLASPFIKKQTADIIAQNCSTTIDLKYINSFKLSNFHRGVSDLLALRILNDHHFTQKNVHNLHAKFFIFDDQAIITSGNLTAGGLRNNLEYGLLVKGEIVEEIRTDYLNIFNLEDYPYITNAILEKAGDILNSVPKEKQKNMKIDDGKIFDDILNDENTVEKYEGGVESIFANLTSWKKDVFECLVEIENDVVNLDNIYSFEKNLSRLHPNNKNIRPKIRQQLQYLRDIGLIEFLKPGIYKKLW